MIAMADVSVADVRIHLNNITTEEVSDETIGQKITDAYFWATQFGLAHDDTSTAYFVRCYAAWRSFISSRSYTKVKIGVVEVNNPWEQKAKELKTEAEEALEEVLGGESIQVVSTPMFDSRPDDPFEEGLEKDEVDQTEL